MSDRQLKIKLNNNSKKVVVPAIMRLNYLMPKYEFLYRNEMIEISSNKKISEDEKSEIKKNVNYIFYKEIIYEDNKSIRKKIYESI